MLNLNISSDFKYKHVWWKYSQVNKFPYLETHCFAWVLWWTHVKKLNFLFLCFYIFVLMFSQSILIHRNSGFRRVWVLFNCKLGLKICKKIFESWRRCNFSSCIFLAVDHSWQMSTSKTWLKLMGFVNFLIFFFFFVKIIIFY